MRSHAVVALPPFLADRGYLANAVGHMTIDILNSTPSLLLALFSASLGLTNTAIGLIATAYTFANSLSQPLFGWLSDRYGVGRLSALGALWMSVFYALALTSPGWWAIGFMVAAALGSAAFHPEGTVKARRVPVAQVTTAVAVFFLFGQMGSGVGPSIAGALLEHVGMPGLLVLVALNAGAGWAMWHYRPEDPPMRRHEQSAATQTARHLGWAVLTLFAFVLLARMTLQSTTVTFLPKYLHDLGRLPSALGLALSMILVGGAIGNVVGGHFADRWGRRPVIVLSLFLAAPALLTYLHLPGPAFYGVLFLAGVCITAGHSVSVVLAQAMLPGRQGLASGLTLGFMFAGGAVGAAVAGWLSDRIGLETVLAGQALVAVAGGGVALLLPRWLFWLDKAGN